MLGNTCPIIICTAFSFRTVSSYSPGDATLNVFCFCTISVSFILPTMPLINSKFFFHNIPGMTGSSSFHPTNMKAMEKKEYIHKETNKTLIYMQHKSQPNRFLTAYISQAFTSPSLLLHSKLTRCPFFI